MGSTLGGTDVSVRVDVFGRERGVEEEVREGWGGGDRVSEGITVWVFTRSAGEEASGEREREPCTLTLLRFGDIVPGDRHRGEDGFPVCTTE